MFHQSHFKTLQSKFDSSLCIFSWKNNKKIGNNKYTALCANNLFNSLFKEDLQTSWPLNLHPWHSCPRLSSYFWAVLYLNWGSISFKPLFWMNFTILDDYPGDISSFSLADHSFSYWYSIPSVWLGTQERVSGSTTPN